MTTTEQTWRLDLPYHTPPLSLNQRLHWAEEGRRKREIRHDAAYMARGTIPMGLIRIHVELHWQPATRRNRDTDNPTPTLKAAIDGLRDAGIVDDDDSSRVSSCCVLEPVAKPTRLWLTITDLSLVVLRDNPKETENG